MKKQKLKLEQIEVSSFITQADIKGGADATVLCISVNACLTSPIDNCRRDSNQYVCLSLPTHCGTINDLCGTV